ncbi:MAG TPA: MEDS domain-containing protein [Ilumatobacteraceae bacterium]|nr:MEDS domain-containing protein [Ilumatobacteraceae bacterium]
MTVKIEVRANPRDHAVLFYEDTEELVTTVAQFVVDGVMADETSIVVATSQHIAAFEDAMVAAGVDIDAARAGGSLLMLEAGQAMSRFLVGDWPQVDLFDSEIGQLLRQASQSGRQVRVYGEMVALLWDAGQVGAAIELETMWNDLRQRMPFSLLCAYPASSVAGDEESFQRVCHCHSAVIGTGAESGDTVTRSFVGDSRSLRGVRQFVVDTLWQWDVEGLCDDATIVVSELATNSILHAQSDFTVALARQAGTVRLSVLDGSDQFPRLRDPSPTTVTGRGLRLVTALATRWGTVAVGGGKEVWADFPVA